MGFDLRVYVCAKFSGATLNLSVEGHVESKCRGPRRLVSVRPGNTGGLDNVTAPAAWNGGEALLRFQPGPVFTNSTRDFFAPANWQALNDADTDIGSSGALLVDLPQAVPQQLAVAMGKNGVVYLADRNNLGGVGGDVFQAQVSAPTGQGREQHGKAS